METSILLPSQREDQMETTWIRIDISSTIELLPVFWPR
jgi:hypothetical protein